MKNNNLIFIIDEDIKSLSLLREILEYNNYEVIEASSGKEALEVLKIKRAKEELVK